MTYIVTLRAGLTWLAVASGLRSPAEFSRHHAVQKDPYGRTTTADRLFPDPTLPQRAAEEVSAAL